MFNETIPGLYSLGSVPDNGFIESACAFGNILDSYKGVVYIVVINSDREVRSFHKVDVEVNGSLCLNKFNNNNHPRKGDLVSVYIPKGPHGNGNQKNDMINQPLQITFYSIVNSNKYKYQFLERSAVSETNVESIKQGINRALRLWNWKDLEDSTLNFNIQVRIIGKN